MYKSFHFVTFCFISEERNKRRKKKQLYVYAIGLNGHMILQKKKKKKRIARKLLITKWNYSFVIVDKWLSLLEHQLRNGSTDFNLNCLRCHCLFGNVLCYAALRAKSEVTNRRIYINLCSRTIYTGRPVKYIIRNR